MDETPQTPSKIKIDRLIRSFRKTVGLQITNDARLIVRAPHFASEDFIYKLIRQKEGWIKAKQDYFKERQNKIPARKFMPSEEFPIFRTNLPVDGGWRNLPKAVVLGQSLMISDAVLGNARTILRIGIRPWR